MPAFNLRDPSLWAIILGNFFSIAMAFFQEWPLYQTLWVYWSQSVIIGIINFYRIINLEKFTTKGLTINDKAVPETTAGKIQIASFFALHYGFFHFIYALFLWTELPLINIPTKDIIFTALCICGFIGSHSYSFRYNANLDFKDKSPHLGTLMFYPYMRIIPMHLIIIFGASMGQAALIVFMILKTVADAGMHVVEHRLFQKQDTPPLHMKD